MTPRKKDKLIQSIGRVFTAVTVGWCLITCSLIFCLDPYVYGPLLFELLAMMVALAFPFFTVSILLEIYKAWDNSAARQKERDRENSISIIRSTIRDRDKVHTRHIPRRRL